MPTSHIQCGKTKPDSFPEADHRMSETIRFMVVISYSRPNVVFLSNALCITSDQLTDMPCITEM